MVRRARTICNDTLELMLMVISASKRASKRSDGMRAALGDNLARASDARLRVMLFMHCHRCTERRHSLRVFGFGFDFEW